VDAIVGDLIKGSTNPTVGILAEPAQILLRITAKAASADEAKDMIAAMEAEIRRRLGSLIFGVDDDTLEGVVCQLLKESKKTLALLETHTGGGIAQRFVTADCDVLTEAFVARSEASLRRFAGIDEAAWSDEKRKHWALCVALAGAARARSGADIALAAVGIAPESEQLAPEEKASGKTCIAVDSADGDAYWEFRFAGTERINQTRATVLSIEMLRRFLTGYVDPEHPPKSER
jgi:nicotinamide-nucleotide amidase